MRALRQYLASVPCQADNLAKIATHLHAVAAFWLFCLSVFSVFFWLWLDICAPELAPIAFSFSVAALAALWAALVQDLWRSSLQHAGAWIRQAGSEGYFFGLQVILIGPCLLAASLNPGIASGMSDWLTATVARIRIVLEVSLILIHAIYFGLARQADVRLPFRVYGMFALFLAALCQNLLQV